MACDFTGLISVPVYDFLFSSSFGSFSSVSSSDFGIVSELKNSSVCSDISSGSRIIPADRARCLRMVKNFSFYPHLYESIMSYARFYAECGLRSLMISVPGFGSDDFHYGFSAEPAVYWIVLSLCMAVKKESGGDFEFILCMPSETGSWSADISCRCGFDYSVVGHSCDSSGICSMCGCGVIPIISLREKMSCSAGRKSTGMVVSFSDIRKCDFRNYLNCLFSKGMISGIMIKEEESDENLLKELISCGCGNIFYYGDSHFENIDFFRRIISCSELYGDIFSFTEKDVSEFKKSHSVL